MGRQYRLERLRLKSSAWLLSESGCRFVQSSPDAHLSKTSRPDFFEPVDLGGQPADLGIQVLELPLVGRCFGPLLPLIALEELRHAVQGLPFPAVQLGGMNAVLRSDLSDGPLFP